MKKILLILLLLVSSIFANSIEWMDYNKALESAKKQDKIIMLMLGRTSCGVCAYMKKVVFEDKNIIKEFNKKYLAVYLEVEFDDIPNDFTYIGTPTFYFLDKNEKTLKRFDGGKTVLSLMKTLKKLQ